MTTYQPPAQSKRGQLIDAVTVLVLIFATLFFTTFLVGESNDDSANTAPAAASVADLPVTPAERAHYQTMIDTGVTDLPSISASVAKNQPQEGKYEFSTAALIGTIVLLAVYLGFVYRTSFREYREVIEEKFGPNDRSGSP